MVPRLFTFSFLRQMVSKSLQIFIISVLGLACNKIPLDDQHLFLLEEVNTSMADDTDEMLKGIRRDFVWINHNVSSKGYRLLDMKVLKSAFEVMEETEYIIYQLDSILTGFAEYPGEALVDFDKETGNWMRLRLNHYAAQCEEWLDEDFDNLARAGKDYELYRAKEYDRLSFEEIFFGENPAVMQVHIINKFKLQILEYADWVMLDHLRRLGTGVSFYTIEAIVTSDRPIIKFQEEESESGKLTEFEVRIRNSESLQPFIRSLKVDGIQYPVDFTKQLKLKTDKWPEEVEVRMITPDGTDSIASLSPVYIMSMIR